jgi:hypothetical protein
VGAGFTLDAISEPRLQYPGCDSDNKTAALEYHEHFSDKGLQSQKTNNIININNHNIPVKPFPSGAVGGTVVIGHKPPLHAPRSQYAFPRRPSLATARFRLHATWPALYGRWRRVLWPLVWPALSVRASASARHKNRPRKDPRKERAATGRAGEIAWLLRIGS